jgi:hypothetical protein
MPTWLAWSDVTENHPWVASLSVSVKTPFPSAATEADIASPGCTGSWSAGKNTGAFGKISYQPW